MLSITEISFRQSKNISLCTFKDATQFKTLLDHARQWRLKQTDSGGGGGGVLDLSKTDEPEKKVLVMASSCTGVVSLNTGRGVS